MKDNFNRIRYSGYDMTIKVDTEALHQLAINHAESMLTMKAKEVHKYSDGLEVFCKYNDVYDTDYDVRDRIAGFECNYGAVAWDSWYSPQFTREEEEAKEEPTREVSYYWEHEEPELCNSTLCLTLEDLLKHAED